MFTVYVHCVFGAKIPLIRIDALLCALFDRNFGIPALFTLNNLVLATVTVVATTLFSLLVVRLPHQVMRPIYFKFKVSV